MGCGPTSPILHFSKLNHSLSLHLSLGLGPGLSPSLGLAFQRRARRGAAGAWAARRVPVLSILPLLLPLFSRSLAAFSRRYGDSRTTKVSSRPEVNAPKAESTTNTSRPKYWLRRHQIDTGRNPPSGRPSSVQTTPHWAAFNSRSMLAATSGPKRKAQSSHPLRPLKQHRTTSFDKMLASDDAADRLSDKGGSDDAGSDSEAVLVGDVPQSLDWQKTIDRVVGSVVAIRFCQPCSFDTDRAMGSEASGFIVDAEKGYILTNRHVVGAGPFWGYCIFDNHEEAETFAVYRDPIHDFGILRFDPKAIKYMKLEAIDLRPDLAQVGLDIRVVGNDAGEKLSILTGIISRLDRNAPVYEEGYSDFNTCYYQANASASGGSSGSPVVNKQGHAIALQAGGREDATTDYFLPLDRPLRALQCIREGKPVTRGDIQCQFYLKPFDECRRLGLTSTWEASVRAAFPDATNMLVAEVVLPDGPAHHKIEEGDVLVQVNGELLTDFIRLDDILDSNVSNRIKLLLQRGGENVDVEIEVGDLHEITPDRFVSVGGGSFHNLSYHQARNHAVACKGVYVCETAGSWLVENDTGWIIQSIDKRKTPDLATFVEVLRTIPDKARIVVTFQYLRDMHKVNTAVIQLDRHWWAEMRMAVRNDVTGRWDFTDLGAALPPAKAVTRSASFVMVENASHPAIADLVRSFVQVDCVLPMKLDGFPKTRRWGMGLVIDAEQGLVLVSRAIVPYDLCDITIVVADSIQVEAKVVFLHPLQNWTVVRYDPSLVDAPVLSAKLGDEPLTQGQAITFVGFNKLGRIVHTATTVTEITAVVIPANTVAPRYRALNLDAITIDTNLGLVCGSGVLVDPKGTVQAVWLTYLADRNMCTQRDEEYHLGLNTSTLLPVVNQIKQGLDPKLRILSVEFRAIPMSQARVMSVSEEWIGKAVAANKTIHQLFMVSKSAFERGDDKPALLAGDIILTLNGKIISTVSDLDVMYNHDVLDALIVRDGQELQVQAPTVSAEDVETDHAVMFCGALFHRPHHAVRQQISTLHSEIYISAQTQGSPASQYGLSPTNFITHVNSVKTTDLKSFLVEVTKIPDNTYFRLKAMTFDSVPWVITMKKNDHYFPTVEWIKDKSEACGWRRVMIGGEKTDNGAAYSAPTPMEEC